MRVHPPGFSLFSLNSNLYKAAGAGGAKAGSQELLMRVRPPSSILWIQREREVEEF